MQEKCSNANYRLIKELIITTCSKKFYEDIDYLFDITLSNIT